MSCMKCLHAHIPSHSRTPSHMPMPSVTTVTGSSNDTHILSPYRLTIPKWATNPESISDYYHTTRSLCDNHNRVYSLGNRTFQLMALVSYTNIELFGSHRWSLTPMFQAFHLTGLKTPFLLHPTHINYISLFLCLNRETLIRRRPKYELTTHSSTLMIDNHTHAHTPNIIRCPCAYAMLMPLHVLMLHV